VLDGSEHGCHDNACMDVSTIDASQLRKHLRLANDVVMAHRIAKGLSLERERVTWAREIIEERVLLALAETDVAAMPEGWSWQQAAETISLQIALAIVHEQKNEPRVAGDEPY
jgi:hypothetical protein